MNKFDDEIENVEYGTYAGKSHVSVTDPQLNSDTYYTRRTGRTANKMNEYIYWYLKAKEDAKKFICTYNNGFPAPFNKAPMEADFSKQQPVKKKRIQKIESYPFDVNYYKNYRREILNLFQIGKHDKLYDITINLRLDDIMNNNGDYTLLNTSYYKTVLTDIGNLDNKKIIMVGAAVSDKQIWYANELKKILENKFNIEIELRLDGTLEEDLMAFMCCETFIASVSSFWFWSIFCSYTLKKLYIPMFGVVNKMNLQDFSNANFKLQRVQVPQLKSFSYEYCLAN